MNTAQRDERIVEHLPLVGYLVSDRCAKISYLDRDELMSAGMIGLIQAVDSYDPSHGVPFGAFARRRIIGAISDDMRAMDWASRVNRERITAARMAEEALTSALGRIPTRREIADLLGVSDKQAAETLEDASRQFSTLDETMSDYLGSEESSPEEMALEDEEMHAVRVAVQSLPEHMRTVVQKLFFENSSVTEIAAEMGLTHSAISQRRTAALELLREAMGSHYGTGSAAEPPTAQKRGDQRRQKYLQQFTQQTQGGLVNAGRTSVSHSV